MRIRVVPLSALPDVLTSNCEIQVVWVDILAQHLNEGDGLVMYETLDECATCLVRCICEVVASDPENGFATLDVRPWNAEIRPDSHARWRWEKAPYLCLDTNKVIKYNIPPLFAAAFSDKSWLTRKLQDSTNEVFRPDLSKQTLHPVKGFVYLIRGPKLHKIGKAENVENRLKQIEKDEGCELEVVHTIRSMDYTRAETRLHNKYKHLRRRGEWFELSQIEIDAICAISDLTLDE